MNFDGVLPASTEVFLANTYSSEDKALPEAVLNHVKQEKGHQNIYVLDRGLQSTRSMGNCNDQPIKFACSAKEKRKHKQLEEITPQTQFEDGSILLKDRKVQLYTGHQSTTKKETSIIKKNLLSNRSG